MTTTTTTSKIAIETRPQDCTAGDYLYHSGTLYLATADGDTLLQYGRTRFVALEPVTSLTAARKAARVWESQRAE